MDWHEKEVDKVFTKRELRVFYVVAIVVAIIFLLLMFFLTESNEGSTCLLEVCN